MTNFNTLKVFLRNIQKQKVVTTMTILGLSLGITIAILIGLWAIQEFSYDDFHQNKERIYRVVWHASFNDQESASGKIARPLGLEAQAQIPEIEKMCRIVNLEDENIEINQQAYGQNKVIIADRNFFDFFTFPLKIGDKNQVLNSLDGIVINESTAALLSGKNWQKNRP